MAVSSSWRWVCIVLLNTMNGPGYVTLPQAGRDAGPACVVCMIVAFGLMAGFVARRAIAVVAECEARRSGSEKASSVDFASLSRDHLGAASVTYAAIVYACVAALVACGLAQIILCVQLAEVFEAMIAGRVCFLAVQVPGGAESRGVLDAGCRAGGPPRRAGPALEVSCGVAATALLCAYAAALEKGGDTNSRGDGEIARSPRRGDKHTSLLAPAALPQVGGAACFAGAALAFVRFARRRSALAAAATWASIARVGPRPLAAAPSICFNFAFVLAIPALARQTDAAAAKRGSDFAVAAMTLAYAAIAFYGGEGPPSAEGNYALTMLSAARAGGDGDGDGTPPGDAAGVLLLYLSQLAAVSTYLAAAQQTVDAAGHRGVKLRWPAWALAVAAKDSGVFAALIEWTSLLLLGFTNFSLPLALDNKLGYPNLKRTSSSDSLDLFSDAASAASATKRGSRLLHVAATSAFVAFVAARLHLPDAAVLALAAATAARLAAARNDQRPLFAPDPPRSVLDGTLPSSRKLPSPDNRHRQPSS